MIQIKNRFTEKVVFESKIATTIKMAVLEAIEKKADLSEANLSKADLSEADLSWANLSRADLSWADLSWADLSWANLLFIKMDKKVFKQITQEWFEWKVKED